MLVWIVKPARLTEPQKPGFVRFKQMNHFFPYLIRELVILGESLVVSIAIAG
jgi:hypothetical protein